MSSLSNRSSLITQIYFPRSIPAISSTFTASIMLIVELAVLACFMVYFQFTPSLTILYLVPIYVLAFVLVLGIALGLSVLNVKFRDNFNAFKNTLTVFAKLVKNRRIDLKFEDTSNIMKTIIRLKKVK